MAEDGVPQSGHGEIGRCEVTRTSTSPGISLMEVISRPSGKGNKGVVNIPLFDKGFLWVGRTELRVDF